MRVLSTPRLHLRHFALEDADFVLGLINEPAWIAGIRDAGVRTREAAQAWVQDRLITPYQTHGHGFWLVERRLDGEPLGMCGIFKRDSLPLPDLGYGFLTRHGGQGYAREAARACLEYAPRQLGLRELLAITSPSNHASNRLLQDLGFVAEHLQPHSPGNPDGPTQHWRWRAAAG
ncbi:GNAT family N-acetyltransferase [Inhella gelatinilytica]|uniref:GNAT family N-acetyltransferase n=1 Tax=Inhella gelatinilytica TaxID=2795030 RepID=A0A931IU20_9BURK|nr:GNAT family N-acetyltransferase [Inhella gelatinilytica]MBH9551531.1 GNAT family N-acetyltransferase [Inhella gelatinilytica]